VATADSQLAALADPTRRAIFERLVKGPLAVGELAAGFPVSRPAVSQHLKALEAARLVAHEKSGTQNIYRANPEGIAALRRYLDMLWTRALGDLKAAAEAPPERSHSPRKRKEKP
jgi:DNA-binding transcriptional ArsR family regulator